MIRPKRSKRWRWWRRLALAAVVLLTLLFRPLRLEQLALSRLDTVPLENYRRVLVLAPHCDDEVLGSGGLIQAALRQGAEVRVVLGTNGDGFFFATARDVRRIRPRPGDFVELGNARQRETVAALEALGVRADHVTFLSYPDRGLAPLWNEHWRRDHPFRSIYTRQTRSPYPVTFDRGAVYAGECLDHDLRTILGTWRPDLVLYPHPSDDHPDHWALSAFTRLALAETEDADRTFKPTALAYLVHRSGFPTPRGYDPDGVLVPPEPIWRVDDRWLRWDLTAADEDRKWTALQQYRSQMPFLHKLLVSFVRSDEVFAELRVGVLRETCRGELLSPETWRDAAGWPSLPVERDPQRDNRLRERLSSADLCALYASRRPDGSLWVAAQARRTLTRAFHYVLRVKAVDADGQVRDYSAHFPARRQAKDGAAAAGSYLGEIIPADRLGHPIYVLVSATTYALGGSAEGLQLDTLDHVAWQLLRVPASPLVAGTPLPAGQLLAPAVAVAPAAAGQLLH